MESNKNISADEEGDATLVTPRFDSDEAETARPVVPLAAVPGEAETYDANASPAYGPRGSRRASLPLALVLVSALAGSVLGGAALYFFQKSRQQSQQRPAPTETAQPAVGDDVSAPAPAAPDAETTPAPEEAGTLAADLSEEVAGVEDADDAEERKVSDTKRDEPKRADDDDDSRAARARASAPAAGPVKQGKKGEREDDGGNRGSRQGRPRRVADAEPYEDDGDDDESGGARRVGSIVYGREERRERRRGRRQPAVDRVRGIFEGQP